MNKGGVSARYQHLCNFIRRKKPHIMEHLNDTGFKNCAISEITKAELVYGAANSEKPLKNYAIIGELFDRVVTLPIIDAIYPYGKEKARLRKAGNMICEFDLLIGCTAVANELIMVTENVSEFQRISDIKIENWTRKAR
jgi:tRNA(fMet)-specific endonuclease VapC